MTREDISRLKAGDKLIHKFRGPVEYTQACEALNLVNCEPSSMFVELEDEVIEVTAACVRRA